MHDGALPVAVKVEEGRSFCVDLVAREEKGEGDGREEVAGVAGEVEGVGCTG